MVDIRVVHVTNVDRPHKRGGPTSYLRETSMSRVGSRDGVSGGERWYRFQQEESVEVGVRW